MFFRFPKTLLTIELYISNVFFRVMSVPQYTIQLINKNLKPRMAGLLIIHYINRSVENTQTSN